MASGGMLLAAQTCPLGGNAEFVAYGIFATPFIGFLLAAIRVFPWDRYVLEGLIKSTASYSLTLSRQ